MDSERNEELYEEKYEEKHTFVKILCAVLSALLAVGTICLILTVYRIPLARQTTLYGKRYDKTCEELDLSGVKVTDFGELLGGLSVFENLKTVDFGDQKIYWEDRDLLESSFPEVEFKVGVFYRLYGRELLETETELDLSQVAVDDQLAENLKLFPNLTTVNLNNHNYTKDQQIALQKEFPQINFQWQVELLSQYVDCNTTELNLSKRQIDDLAEFRKSLTLLKNLQKLDMTNTNLTNEELGALREEFPNVQIDWVVHFGKWSMRTDTVAFSVLIYTYDYRRMNSKDIEVLKYCTKLQALDLGHQVIEDVTVIGDYMPELRLLILADNQIKDITPLGKLKHLHYIELFMNNITDVSALANCRELVDVNICFNYRFANIDPLLNFPLLERLWLIADKISAADYQRIRETYPNVKLVTTGSGSTKSGWRTHERYYKMIDMFHKNYISDVFTKYDGAAG